MIATYVSQVGSDEELRLQLAQRTPRHVQELGVLPTASPRSAFRDIAWNGYRSASHLGGEPKRFLFWKGLCDTIYSAYKCARCLPGVQIVVAAAACRGERGRIHHGLRG